MERLFRETVSENMWKVLQKLIDDKKLNDFNLVGGTALSLLIGHRLSIDIDLFTGRDFDAQQMLRQLKDNHEADIGSYSKNAVFTFIDDIKIDVIAHKYPLIKPVETIEGVRLVSIEDIGAMKLHAIFQSGSRLKDFFDMYFLLEHRPLNVYLKAYEEKYNGNPKMAAYGLLYYDNILSTQTVDMLSGKENDWNQMKLRLKKAVENQHIKFEPLARKERISPPIKRKGRRW